MSEVQKFVDEVKKTLKPVSLRSVFPGREKAATQSRKAVKEAIGTGSMGVQYDSQRGVYLTDMMNPE